MSVEIPGFKYSKEAGADLSTKQFHFVKLNNAGQVVPVAAITDRPIGILQNKPTAIGQAAEIMADGISRLIGSADHAIGDALGMSATGRAATIVPGTATTQYLLGTVLLDGNGDGQECSVVFSCLAPGRAA
jgi:hypothetical protein